MEDGEKTLGQLVEEIAALRRRVRELERSEAELQRVYKVLALGAETLEMLLEYSREIFMTLRPDGTIGYISPSVERVAGYKLIELTSSNAFDLIHPDDKAALMEKFYRELEAKEGSIDVEFRYIHKDGSWHFMEAEGINLVSNPTISGMVITARDITDRKTAEMVLHRRERYYRSLIRNAGDTITVLDRDFNIIWGSIGAARVTGYTPEEIYGNSFLDYVAPENVEGNRALFESLLQDPGGTKTLEGPFKHKNGSWHYYEAVVTNLLEDPSVQGIVINSRDVTERKLVEEQLLASNRELDIFATTVSHDLRTPLSLIEGYAQLMRSEDSSAEEKEAYLKSIITAARRMDELTESLLEYAQAGKAVGKAVPVEPLDVISDILFEHSSVIESKNIEVTLGKEFPAIIVDPLKLRQVVANLVNNAVKYAGDSPLPRIEIGMDRSGETATFHIRDNGPGLEPEEKDDVFSPFKRFGASRSPGLGIGLSTVKRAVEGWGGSIWVESEPGKGSAFYFTAPAV